VGVLAGESATLYCYGPALPIGRVNWWQNSDRIVQDRELNDVERFNLTCSLYMCQLTIISAQMEDSGEYSCQPGTYYGDTYYSRVTVIRE